MNNVNNFNHTSENGSKTSLRELKLHEVDGQYFLEATYDVQTPHKTFVLNIPSVHLPVDKSSVSIRCNPAGGENSVTVGMGFGFLEAKANEKGVFYTETITEEKPHKMTLAEIEQDCGGRVMNKNRWWFSTKQRELSSGLISSDGRRSARCEVFVDGEWKEYTEWRTSPFGESNFSDAVLVAESYESLPIRIDGKEQGKVR